MNVLKLGEFVRLFAANLVFLPKKKLKSIEALFLCVRGFNAAFT